MSIIIQFVFYFLVNFLGGSYNTATGASSTTQQESQLIIEHASYEVNLQESVVTDYYGLLTEVEIATKLPTYTLFCHSFLDTFALSALIRKSSYFFSPDLRDFPDQRQHLPVYILCHSLRIPL